MEVLEDLNRNGRTIFVVTHDPRMSQYADQIIQMLDGEVQQDGQTYHPTQSESELPL